MTFAVRDTWHADEFGFMFSEVPVVIISKSVVLGRKKITRMKFLMCFNACEPEKKYIS